MLSLSTCDWARLRIEADLDSSDSSSGSDSTTVDLVRLVDLFYSPH